MAGRFAQRGVAILNKSVDTGCAVGGPSCLECRLDVCVEDLGEREANKLRLAAKEKAGKQ